VIFKVAKKLDEMEIYTISMSIVEDAEFKDAPFTFDEVVVALKEVCYDRKKAVKAIQKKRLEKVLKAQNKDDQIQGSKDDEKMFTVNANTDDDLY